MCQIKLLTQHKCILSYYSYIVDYSKDNTVTQTKWNNQLFCLEDICSLSFLLRCRLTVIYITLKISTSVELLWLQYIDIWGIISTVFIQIIHFLIFFVIYSSLLNIIICFFRIHMHIRKREQTNKSAMVYTSLLQCDNKTRLAMMNQYRERIYRYTRSACSGLLYFTEKNLN